jgi:hypothetical protein
MVRNLFDCNDWVLGKILGQVELHVGTLISRKVGIRNVASAFGQKILFSNSLIIGRLKWVAIRKKSERKMWE